MEQPSQPEDGYHFSADIADKAIEFISDAKQIAPDKPFFMYYCPGVAHAPHHVAPEWADRYKGRFDEGYEAVREETIARQKEIGIVPPDTDLSPTNPLIDATNPDGKPWSELDVVRPWDTLDDDEKRLFTRMGEVYAGMVAHTDHELGRVIDFLEQSGELDNTIIVVISDNGASGEGGPNGSVNENKFFNGVPDSMEENLKYLDVLGGPETYNHYATGWAMAFNTPHKMWKRYAWNGGICDPFIISWPNGIAAQGEIRDQYCHVTDVTPTIYEMLGLELPTEVKGYTQWDLEGTSIGYSFEDADAETRKDTQFYSMLGSRGIYHKGWKANTVHPTIADWSNFSADEWALYHVDEDRSETHNLAEAHPEKLQQLTALWYHEAGKYQGFPLEDRGAVAVLTTPRPQLAPPRDRYVYRPNTAEVPEGAAANVRNRSYKIAAEVTIDAGDTQGVLFSHVDDSVAMHSSSRTHGCTTSTTGSAKSSRRSSLTSTSRRATSSSACRSTRKATTSNTARPELPPCSSTTSRSDSVPSRPNRASSCWPAKVSMSARTPAARSAPPPTRRHSHSPEAASAR